MGNVTALGDARLGLLAVAGASAVLSWRAITEVAGAQGAVAPELA